MRRALFILPALLIALAWGISYQALAPKITPQGLSNFMPQGALLSVEARDFNALLSQWKTSPEYAAWINSDNYSEFSRSRLFERLSQAQGEFAAAAGLSPNLDLLNAAAGQQSAVALYDIGNLEFVYITRMPSARSAQTAIWQRRTSFEPRNAGGTPFFIRTDPHSKRVVGFGATDEYFVLGTREDLIAGALAALAGQSGRTLAESDWYRHALAAAPSQPGDIRMFLDLGTISHTPHFRSYWIQRNITETRQYSSAVVDLYREPKKYREERVLLRAPEPGSAAPQRRSYTPAGEAGVAELSKFVGGPDGVYRVTANPDADEAAQLLQTKVLNPQAGPGVASTTAPQVSLGSGVCGCASDLETRIDDAPDTRIKAQNVSTELQTALRKAGLDAMLQIESTQIAPNGVFVRPHTVLVFMSGSQWDGSAMRLTMQREIVPSLTAGVLGAQWQREGDIYALDGVLRLAISSQGKYLFVSDDPQMLAAVLARSSQKPAVQPARYAAGFNHVAEKDNFVRLTSLLDRSHAAATAAASDARTPRKPEFFSGNVASLSYTLKDVTSESVVIRQAPAGVQQTVIYKWAK